MVEARASNHQVADLAFGRYRTTDQRCGTCDVILTLASVDLWLELFSDTPQGTEGVSVSEC